MSKRTRLEIYDDFPSDIIDEAINAWIKDKRQRQILHYKLVDNLTYEEIASIMKSTDGRYRDIKTVQRAVYKAETKLFPNIQIIYQRKTK